MKFIIASTLAATVAAQEWHEPTVEEKNAFDAGAGVDGHGLSGGVCADHATLHAVLSFTANTYGIGDAAAIQALALGPNGGAAGFNIANLNCALCAATPLVAYDLGEMFKCVGDLPTYADTFMCDAEVATKAFPVMDIASLMPPPATEAGMTKKLEDGYASMTASVQPFPHLTGECLSCLDAKKLELAAVAPVGDVDMSIYCSFLACDSGDAGVDMTALGDEFAYTLTPFQRKAACAQAYPEHFTMPEVVVEEVVEEVVEVTTEGETTEGETTGDSPDEDGAAGFTAVTAIAAGVFAAVFAF